MAEQLPPFIAFVMDNTEAAGKGVLHCWPEADEDYIGLVPHIPNEDKWLLLPVIYTSPYSHHYEGAMVAIPAEGTRIIVQEVQGQFYYVNSILHNAGDYKDHARIYKPSCDINALKYMSAEGPHHKIYGKDKMPNTVLFKHPAGHRLHMTEDRPLDGSKYVTKAEFRSGAKKRLSLDDSPKVNCIQLGIDRGLTKDIFDGITIGHGPGGIIGARCIKIETENTIQNISWGGSIRDRVVAGKNWTAENTSLPPMADAGRVTDPFNFGHVNLGSQYGDVNIQTGTIADLPIRTSGGLRYPTIYISQAAPFGTIKVDSNGDVRIYSRSLGINIESMADINIDSKAGSINMTAAQGINMTAGPRGIGAFTPGVCALRGSTIQLNSPGFPTIPAVPPIPPYGSSLFGTGATGIIGPALYIPFPSFYIPQVP